MNVIKNENMHLGRLALALSCTVLAAWFVFARVGKYGERGTCYATYGAIAGGHLLLLNIILAAAGLRRKERPRWIAFSAIILSAVPALFAVYADGWLLTNVAARSEQKSELVQILVARRDLPAGHVLETYDLETREMRTVNGQPRFVPSREAPSVLGRTILFPLEKAHPLMWDSIQGHTEAMGEPPI